MLDTPSFRPYYEAAQTFLAEKWIDGTINQAIAQRYLRIYDPELRENENIDADEKEVRKAMALKSETRAVEEERNRVLEEINRSKRELS